MASSKIQANTMPIVEELAVTNVTVAASGIGTATIETAKTGYTPIGIVGIRKSGSSHGTCAIAAYYLDGTTATILLANTSATARTITVRATILYVPA